MGKQGSVHVFAALSTQTILDVTDYTFICYTSIYPNDLIVTGIDKSDFDTSGNEPGAYAVVANGATHIIYHFKI